jgi:hypothetical protein
MHGAQSDDFQDEHVQRSLQQVRFFDGHHVS